MKKSFEISEKESFWRDNVYLQETEIDFLGKKSKVVASNRRNSFIKYFSWKDLNTAMDLLAYKKRIRLYECDEFTREYLTSEGIEGLGRTI